VRHLSLQELLALQDGEDLATAREHLRACPQCLHQRDLLRARQQQLRSLPSLRPARDAWPSIQAALVRHRRRRRAGLAIAALAAALALAIGMPGLLRHAGPTARSEELATWMKRSQDLEERLRAVPEPAMLDVSSADTLVELEDQIAFVDRCLDELSGDASARESATALWQARVELLEALINVRMPSLALLSP